MRRFDFYPPRSPSLTNLLAEALTQAALPASWAGNDALHTLIELESGGWIGRPNYQFGEGATPREQSAWLMRQRNLWASLWAAVRADTWRERINPMYAEKPSSATGLGQLTRSTILEGGYYPSNLGGIGHPLEEAMGLVRYVARRYGTPEAALEFHRAHGWY